MCYISNPKGLLMAGELHEISRAIGRVEVSTENIASNLTEVKADMAALKDSFVKASPMWDTTAQWVEAEGKPAVKAMHRAKHIAMGAVGVSALGSSPSWIPKLAALMHAIFP